MVPQLFLQGTGGGTDDHTLPRYRLVGSRNQVRHRFSGTGRGLDNAKAALVHVPLRNGGVFRLILAVGKAGNRLGQ